MQKMAEAHMQNLGVHPPFEDPCEGEEDEEHWEGVKGEDMSPTKTGERENLCRLARTKENSCQQQGTQMTHVPIFKGKYTRDTRTEQVTLCLDVITTDLVVWCVRKCSAQLHVASIPTITLFILSSSLNKKKC